MLVGKVINNPVKNFNKQNMSRYLNNMKDLRRPVIHNPKISPYKPLHKPSEEYIHTLNDNALAPMVCFGPIKKKPKPKLAAVFTDPIDPGNKFHNYDIDYRMLYKKNVNEELPKKYHNTNNIFSDNKYKK